MNKYEYVKILQAKYGSSWSDEFIFTDEEGYNTLKDRKEMLQCYRDNAPQYEYRIINRRVLTSFFINSI